MPLPLVYAAGATVARYIAKRGVGAAVKKFTKGAISEGKKHLKDLKGGKTPKELENIRKVKKAHSGTANTRQTIRRAGLGGFVIGAAATKSKTYKTKSAEAKSAASKSKSVAKPARKPTSDGRTNPKDYPTYKKSTKSAGSFRSATAAAKKAGNKTFTWEGRRYNTKEK